MTEHRPDPHAADVDRQQLIALLDTARRYTGTVLDAVRDPAQVVHADSGWTVADVTGHILVWEQAFARTVAALHAGDPPPTLDGFTSFEDFNRRQRDRLHGIPLARLREDLDAVRARIKAALGVLSPERFEDRIAFPWLAEGTLSALVLVMAAHERAHAREIAVAIGAAGVAGPA